MVFSTPIFLFYFLAATLLLYYLVPRKGRNVVLLLASLFFYYWGERSYTVIMLLSTVVDYSHGLLVERCKGRGNLKGAKLAVASSMVSATWASCSSSSITTSWRGACRRWGWTSCRCWASICPSASASTPSRP